LLLRFENLGQKDADVNVTGIAEAFWRVNQASGVKMNIEAMSLTGNMPLSEK